MTAHREEPISFSCLKVKQPIGEFFIASINHKQLCEITFSDVRRIAGERDFETYLGIQRPLNEARIGQLQQYVNTVDASFPTSVILAIDGRCVEFNDADNTMHLRSFTDSEIASEQIPRDKIAKVLDGQHRIAGLAAFNGPDFNVNVSIFVDMDIAEQAQIFATVNLAQTKVNQSLAYDLFDLAKSRSPQKTCHNIAVALNKSGKSPFANRIKRLGVSTEGKFDETITQATFVKSLMRYISKNPLKDRDVFMRGGKLPLAPEEDLQSLVFRNMFIQEKDFEIADVLWNFFQAVKTKWPHAWDPASGNMLSKSNAFRALMRFLGPAYLEISSPGKIPPKEDFDALLAKVKLQDSDFTIDRFKPGTSGEALLFRTLLDDTGIAG